MRLSAAMAAVIAAAGFAGQAQALGVSGPLTHSALGQPLNLLFPVRLNADETLGRDCVRAEVLAGEARVPQGLLQFRLEADAEGAVRAVRLLSTVQIDEPIVTINLSLGCPARFTRQFTAFIDPADLRPTIAAPPQALPDAATVAVVPADATTNGATSARAALPSEIKPAPAPAIAPAPAMTASPARPAPDATARLLAQAPATPQKPAVKPRPKPKPAPPPAPAPAVVAAAEPASAAPPPAVVSRLRLDPTDVPSAPAQPASEAASAVAPDETLVRLQALEDKLDQVHRENVAAEDQFKVLQAQLDDARNQRYHNVLVYGLGVFLAALSVICAYLWRSRQLERVAHEKAWWNEVDRARRERLEQRASQPMPLKPLAGSLPPSPAPVVVSLEPQIPSTIAVKRRRLFEDPGPTSLQPDFDEQTMASAFVDAEQRSLGPSRTLARNPQEPVEAEPSPTAPLPLMQEAVSLQFAEESRNGNAGTSINSVILDDENHEVSVEELIDLEQQVDFFEVIGQDEAAIELIKLRIATGQASALPYLKLMEIHQRRGDQEEFARLSGQFAERFKALPPTWGAKLNEGRGLEAYTRVLDFIQQHWSDAGASMALLQNLLSHGGEDAQGFDLPAYRDLLLLYALARDQSEREVRGEEIDLFLPLETSRESKAATAMMATQPMEVVPEKVMLDLHLDIDLDQPA